MFFFCVHLIFFNFKFKFEVNIELNLTFFIVMTTHSCDGKTFVILKLVLHTVIHYVNDICCKITNVQTAPFLFSRNCSHFLLDSPIWFVRVRLILTNQGRYITHFRVEETFVSYFLCSGSQTSLGLQCSGIKYLGCKNSKTLKRFSRAQPYPFTSWLHLAKISIFGLSPSR